MFVQILVAAGCNFLLSSCATRSDSRFATGPDPATAGAYPAVARPGDIAEARWPRG